MLCVSKTVRLVPSLDSKIDLIDFFLKCNPFLTTHVRPSVGGIVRYNFLKGQETKRPCSYQST